METKIVKIDPCYGHMRVNGLRSIHEITLQGSSDSITERTMNLLRPKGTVTKHRILKINDQEWGRITKGRRAVSSKRMA